MYDENWGTEVHTTQPKQRNGDERLESYEGRM
jgi:hypothetical protein